MTSDLFSLANSRKGWVKRRLYSQSKPKPSRQKRVIVPSTCRGVVRGKYNTQATTKPNADTATGIHSIHRVTWGWAACANTRLKSNVIKPPTTANTNSGSKGNTKWLAGLKSLSSTCWLAGPKQTINNKRKLYKLVRKAPSTPKLQSMGPAVWLLC